jgi:hypothetical protein
MSPSEVHRHVCAAFDEFQQRCLQSDGTQTWEHFLDDLIAWIGQVEPSVAFAGLLSILESEQQYVYQNIAGELLDKVSIDCPLSLEGFMRRVLPVWNVSVASVPRFAARTFGCDAVLMLMRNLKAGGVTWPGRGTLDGVRYQLGEHPGNV